MPENFGPERYGVHRKHRRIDADLMPVQQILQISPSKQSEAPPDTTSAIEHLDMMIRRIAMDSMTDIIRVIRELENMSEMLRNEGERVSREVSGYASLNQAATAAMKVIAESLNNGKSGHPKIRKSPTDLRRMGSQTEGDRKGLGDASMGGRASVGCCRPNNKFSLFYLNVADISEHPAGL